MACGPCEERRARLEAAVQGAPLPARDYAFYAGWGLAVVLGGALLWQLRRGKVAR